MVADRNNLNFNSDLPKKIGLQWDNLMPDFPYLSYRNAYLLGEGFTVRDLRYTGEQMSMDSWCNVLLDENSLSERSIPLLMPAQLTAGDAGEAGCFYCGIHGHTAAQCPTRQCPPSGRDLWDNVANLDLDAINVGFRRIEQVLTEQHTAGYDILLAEGGDAALVLQGVLDINGMCQLRHVPQHWLYRMRDPEPGETPPPHDDSPAWDLLKKLAAAPPEGLAEIDKKTIGKISRYIESKRLTKWSFYIHV